MEAAFLTTLQNGIGNKHMTLKKVFAFAGRKLLKLFLLIAAVEVITFALMEASPIDPVTAYVGASTSIGAEQRELIAEKWGLNKPPLERFGSWFFNILHGDWGDSMIYRRPVMEVVGQKFAASLVLMAAAWILSGLLGFFLGIAAGMRENSLADRLISSYCHLLISTPAFWLGIFLIIVFSVRLHWLPVGLSVPIGVLQENVSFTDRVTHLILPAMTLTLTGIAGICLHTREKTIEILQSDYVLYAKARGESRKSILRHHVYRNVLLPAVTLQFLSFSELFGGAVFVEQVFSYPGLGYTTVQAGLRSDMPLLMGITIISVVFVFMGNLIADLLYFLIDPRIREGGQRG